MADSKSEQIFDKEQAAVCQDAIYLTGCIAPSTKCFRLSLIMSPISCGKSPLFFVWIKLKLGEGVTT